tara:strand:- start:1004 stop:1246 length:243 start_codon:yes stop_codon:yes gene_type:complete
LFYKSFYPTNVFLAVFAALLKLAAVGAPSLPGLRIFSPEPAFILLRLAWMFAYSPGFAIISPKFFERNQGEISPWHFLFN